MSTPCSSVPAIRRPWPRASHACSRDRDLADRLARQAWSRAATFSWAARAERIDQVLQGVVTPAALANAGLQA